MSALSQALEDHASALTAALVDALLQNPFWLDRGRPFAEEKAVRHLGALRQALDAGDPELFVRYARSLQADSTASGMCSRHLAESLERLAQTLAGSDLPDVEPGRKLLLAGAAALVYPDGPATGVERVAGAAGRLALETLDASLPGWQQGWCDAPAPTSGEQARYWTSYVVDAVALGQSRSLASYFEWLARHLVDRGKEARLAQDIRGALRYGFSAQKEDGSAAVEVLDALEAPAPERGR